MKKLFTTPEVEVVTFDTMDVITTSPCDGDSCPMDNWTICQNDDCPDNFYDPCPEDWA